MIRSFNSFQQKSNMIESLMMGSIEAGAEVDLIGAQPTITNLGNREILNLVMVRYL